jgi:hypothetical protein
MVNDFNKLISCLKKIHGLIYCIKMRLGGRDQMRFTEADDILDGQILESPYEEVTEHTSPKVDSFVHKFVLYKMFFIFVIGSVFGCYMEQIQYYLHRGIWESRAGVIWGPFSEIYGLGAIIIYVIYKKMNGRSPLTIFCLSAVCGSAFEYIARLFAVIPGDGAKCYFLEQPGNIFKGRTADS